MTGPTHDSAAQPELEMHFGWRDPAFPLLASREESRRHVSVSRTEESLAKSRNQDRSHRHLPLFRIVASYLSKLYIIHDDRDRLHGSSSLVLVNESCMLTNTS